MKTKKVIVSQTLSKVVKIVTDDTENSMKEAFEKEHWDIKSLLSVLKDYVIEDMTRHITNRGARQLEVLAMACDNWHENEYLVKEIK